MMPTTVVIGIIALASACLHDHEVPRQAFGARGADVVLAQHLQHGGARDAREQADLQQGERDAGMVRGAQPADRVVGEGDVAAGRQPAELTAKKMIISRPSKKFGTEMPSMANIMAT